MLSVSENGAGMRELAFDRKDMEIILDALECLCEHLKHYKDNSPNYSWTTEEVDGLYEALDNISID